MKKYVGKLFSGATDSLSYLKETKDFLLGMIVPVIAFTLSLLIPVDTPFRLLTGVLLGLIFFMVLLFSVRLSAVRDNKEVNNIKRENYKFKYTATDLFINELSKTGYNLEFDTERENNQGTV
jgi:hypothetical protein